MPDREDRVAEKHARPRETHDLVHLLAHVPRVAVDRAFLARGFLFAVRAFDEPVARVVEQGLAPRAQLAIPRPDVERMRLAPDVDHRLDRPLLAAEARRREKGVLEFLRDHAHPAILSHPAPPVADAGVSSATTRASVLP